MRIAINGFGRIGRTFLRSCLDNSQTVVAINDTSPVETMLHLFKYDSTFGKLNASIDCGVEKDDLGRDFLTIASNKICTTAILDPQNLPWRELGIDVVVDCTGKFTSSELLGKHIQAGARCAIMSCPAKDDMLTVVYGVNHREIVYGTKLISNASCTTNCLAPIAKIINDNFTIESGFMTTIHAYTSDQRLLDASHTDLRRARAATRSIIPTSTGAASAIGIVLPELSNKLSGIALRVPVENGSMIDLICKVKKSTTKSEVNNLMKEASQGLLRGVLEYNIDKIVSVDIIGNRHSAVFDADLTDVKGDFIKVFAWYDNESAYSERMLDVANYWYEQNRG